MRVLTVNAGSSSLKLALLDDDDDEAVLAQRELRLEGTRIDEDAVRGALEDGLGGANAVGHRIVHGGTRFRRPVQIDANVEVALRELTELAPLHQPKSLAALDAVSAALPELPAVACFDTAFHATMPEAAATYALPAQWRERFGLRRYGFHGLSHAWVARRAPQLLGREPDRADPAQPRIVSCHLGAGASLCAIAGGESRDTTMGFTPLEGLVMATRSGSVDPGLLLWLLEHEDLSAAQLADALEYRSGLLGLAGSADMREILMRAGARDGSRGAQAARLALDVYVHRLRSGIAAMTASLGGIDALVFTGGVGEGSATVRRRAVDGLGFLGVALDPERNAAETMAPATNISAESASAATLVIAAREDLEIARQVRTALAG